MNAHSAWRDLPMAVDGVALSHRARAGERPLLMVHGIGPGTTGRGNFGPLLDALPSHLAVHLVDLAGFGASGRKPAPPYFDPAFWLRQIDSAIDQILEIHGRAPVLIGNSVGGALVLKAAAARPEVTGVLAIGAPTGSPATAALKAFWTAPGDATAMAEAMRPMTGPQAPPDPDLIAARLQPFLSGDYGDYFNAMLANPDACLAGVALTDAEASRLETKQVTLIHGRLDRACPASATLTDLFPRLPQADLILLGGCGHNVIAERTSHVLATIERLVEKNNPR